MIRVTLNKGKDMYLINGITTPTSQYIVDALSKELNVGDVPKTDVQIKVSIGRALKELKYIQSEDSFAASYIGYGCGDYVDIVEFCI